jgi:hypothetical protein
MHVLALTRRARGNVRRIGTLTVVAAACALSLSLLMNNAGSTDDRLVPVYFATLTQLLTGEASGQLPNPVFAGGDGVQMSRATSDAPPLSGSFADSGSVQHTDVDVAGGPAGDSEGGEGAEGDGADGGVADGVAVLDTENASSGTDANTDTGTSVAHPTSVSSSSMTPSLPFVTVDAASEPELLWNRLDRTQLVELLGTPQGTPPSHGLEGAAGVPKGWFHYTSCWTDKVGVQRECEPVRVQSSVVKRRRLGEIALGASFPRSGSTWLYRLLEEVCVCMYVCMCVC